MFAPAEENRRSRPPTRRHGKWYLAVYWLCLLLLTHWPNLSPIRGEPQHLDKLVHFTLYCVLSGLAAAAFTSPGSPTAKWRMLAVLLVAIAFGLVDETTQPFTGRDFDWWDWLADILGATTGVLALGAWRRRQTSEYLG